MVGVSRLCCGAAAACDDLRYGAARPGPHAVSAAQRPDRKPVVVWNCTRRCNLRCEHCYSQSDDRAAGGELTHDEGLRLIDDLAGFGVPVLLLSGGEPLLRPRVVELAGHAAGRGLRVAFSTNGTHLTPDLAARLRDAGVSYAGISLDGLEPEHDRLRGVPGAFRCTLDGVRSCLGAGLKVGLRFTITRANAGAIGAVFDLVAAEGIPRICFYHLVYAGRGSALAAGSRLAHAATRAAVDLIVERTRDLHRRGRPVEVLTVDNHTDGPYLLLRLRREAPERAEEAFRLLRANGGNSSGGGIGCVSWDGTVHPDQFWRHADCGNVRERPFGAIWGAPPPDSLLGRLRRRREFLTGRCAACRWLDLCNGNLRVRAEALAVDAWAPDPDCYLTDEEIAP